MKTKQSLLHSCWSSQGLSTADMKPLLISVLLAAVCLESRAQKDNVLQPETAVTAAEGETVTLGCLYNTSSSNYYLYWYKQDGSNSPEFILSRFTFGEGKTEKKFQERFSSALNSISRSVPLKIQKLHVSDSAVYYCALQPTVTGNSTTLYKNLWSKDNTILHNIHQRDSHTISLL
ncbi:T cell receptor alpha variable 38-1 [Menidia menidia]